MGTARRRGRPGVEACVGQAALHNRSPLGDELAHGCQSQGGWDNCSVRITGIDHIVLTVHSIEASVDFYSRVLGMGVITFERGRTALRFGDQKINLHAADDPIAPHATQPCVWLLTARSTRFVSILPPRRSPWSSAPSSGQARMALSAASTCATPIGTS